MMQNCLFFKVKLFRNSAYCDLVWFNLSKTNFPMESYRFQTTSYRPFCLLFFAAGHSFVIFLLLSVHFTEKLQFLIQRFRGNHATSKNIRRLVVPTIFFQKLICCRKLGQALASINGESRCQEQTQLNISTPLTSWKINSHFGFWEESEDYNVDCHLTMSRHIIITNTETKPAVKRVILPWCFCVSLFGSQNAEIKNL